MLAVIPARAGSKGLAGKCVARLCGRPLIDYTLDHALRARRVTAVCVTTDSAEAAAVARRRGVYVVDRPAELATDDAPVVGALRHAVGEFERVHGGFRAEVIVLLYANIPVRADDIIDRAIAHLVATGADSVRTVAAVGRHHPDWLHRLEGDRLVPYRANLVHRRQDLEPLYYHDGAVVAVTRVAFDTPPSGPDDHHAFFGRDRRAIVQAAEAAVDVDTAADLRVAEAVLGWRAAEGGCGCVEIGGRVIGAGAGLFVIAEAGVNHDGKVEAARRLVRAAREAGADAVKFQAFSAARLAGSEAACCGYQKRGGMNQGQRDMLQRLELRPEAFSALQREAQEAGIVFLATPFGLEEVAMLDALDVGAVKIASSDLTNVPLLRAAAGTGRPLICSTGAAELEEVDQAVAALAREGARQRLILLHCVSQYPTPPDECNLAAIDTLRRRYGIPVGFSDHTATVETGALAVAAGAVVLEKHLTLDRGGGGPDHFFSLTPEDFAAYVRQSRAAFAARGTGCITVTEGQREVRRLARGSIVVRRDVPAGTRLTAEQLTVRRPGDGIAAVFWDQVVGRVVNRAVRAGTPLAWEWLERRVNSTP